MGGRRLYTDENGRVCTTCFEYKPWNEFTNDRHRKNGHSPECRECAKKRRNDFYLKKKQEHGELIQNDHGRECARCRKYFPWSEFENGTSWCKKCKEADARQKNAKAERKERERLEKIRNFTCEYFLSAENRAIWSWGGACNIKSNSRKS
jgi:hypothetical protein